MSRWNVVQPGNRTACRLVSLQVGWIVYLRKRRQRAGHVWLLITPCSCMKPAKSGTWKGVKALYGARICISVSTACLSSNYRHICLTDLNLTPLQSPAQKCQTCRTELVHLTVQSLFIIAMALHVCLYVYLSLRVGIFVAHADDGHSPTHSSPTHHPPTHHQATMAPHMTDVFLCALRRAQSAIRLLTFWPNVAAGVLFGLGLVILLLWTISLRGAGSRNTPGESNF